MEKGLRHRLRRAVRQIATQHEQLRTLHAAMNAAIEKGNVADVLECVDRLRGAVDAHYSLEEGVFFPAVHGLYPESAAELTSLAREHVVALADLDGMRAGLAARGVREFAQAFREFSAATAAHEGREERLLESLADRFEETP